LAGIHETGFASPCKVSDAPAEYIEQQLNGIVGLEMPISEERGKMNTPESLSMSKLLRAATEKA
jgi:transcriptional regulator